MPRGVEATKVRKAARGGEPESVEGMMMPSRPVPDLLSAVQADHGPVSPIISPQRRRSRLPGEDAQDPARARIRSSRTAADATQNGPGSY